MRYLYPGWGACLFAGIILVLFFSFVWLWVIVLVAVSAAMISPLARGKPLSSEWRHPDAAK